MATESDTQQWGAVGVGDRVTTDGRAGTGQPVVTGTIVEVVSDGRVVIQPDDDSDRRRRSIRNVRKVSESG